jgi:hypothetical protein
MMDRAQLSERFTYEFARRIFWPVPRIIIQHVLQFRQRIYSVFSEGIVSPDQHMAVQVSMVYL